LGVARNRQGTVVGGGQLDVQRLDVGSVRGFDSNATRGRVENRGIDNAICPKAPSELKKRMKEP
jgi:hypothetical protein